MKWLLAAPKHACYQKGACGWPKTNSAHEESKMKVAHDSYYRFDASLAPTSCHTSKRYLNSVNLKTSSFSPFPKNFTFVIICII